MQVNRFGILLGHFSELMAKITAKETITVISLYLARSLADESWASLLDWSQHILLSTIVSSHWTLLPSKPLHPVDIPDVCTSRTERFYTLRLALKLTVFLMSDYLLDLIASVSPAWVSKSRLMLHTWSCLRHHFDIEELLAVGFFVKIPAPIRVSI